MNIRSIAMNEGSRLSDAAHSISSEATLFGSHLCRLVKRDETLKTRIFVITEIAGLALAAYGAVQIGFGIAACATGVGAPAGLWLIAKGGYFLASGYDTYKKSSNVIKYGITLSSVNTQVGLTQLNSGTLNLDGKVISAFRSCVAYCVGCFRRH